MKISAREQRLCEAIEKRRAELLADLACYVALPTGRNNTTALDETRDLLTARLKRLGAEVGVIPGDPRPGWLHEGDAAAGSYAVPPTAVASRLASKGARCRVLLCGHLDTVHDPDGPFRGLTMCSDGKTAKGPGCVDMKGGLVIALAALEALDECGISAAWGFVLNSDEETGSYHSDRTIRAEAANYDVGLVVEPALPDGSLVVERPGSGQFCIECEGRPAHVGRDFKSGVSAILALADRIQRVHSLADPDRGRIANLGVITGGSATNVVPSHARGWGNIRFRTDADGVEMSGALDALAADGPAKVRVLQSLNRPAKPLVPATQALAVLARRAAEDLGQSLPFGTTGGVCDGNNMQAAGLPTIDTLGVRGGGLHTLDEWIDLSSLVERCQLLAVLIARLCEQGPPVSRS